MFKILKTFYRFAAEKHFAYAVYVLLVITASVLSSITPYFYKLLVDAIPSQNFQKLLGIICIYLGVNVLSLLVSEVGFQLGNFNLIDASVNARITIFNWVQKLDFAFHSGKSTGGLISIFKRGDNAFFDFFFILHHRLLDIAVSFIVMICFFVALDIRIAIIALGSMFIALFAIKFLVENNNVKRNKFNDEEDKIVGIVSDNLLAYETVKLFAREKWERKRLANAFEPWTKKLWSFFNTYRIIDFTIGSIINLGIFTILLFGSLAITKGTISIGDFVLVAGFISAFFPQLWNLVWSIRDIAKSYSDIQKYFGLLGYQIEVKDPIKPVKISHVYGEINFNNIHFTYSGRAKNAINGISFKIDQGQSVALVGRSGSGKTTLAKLLMRFYDLDSGEITIDGINIKDFTKSTLRSFVGVVPQEPILFNNTIAYNIGYGKDKPKLREIRAASRLANIDDFIEGLREKYNTEVGERGVKLSGGQKQRLAIARMILSDPDIVVFDEATSHLDSESEKLIQDAFWKARSGKTTIIIAHRLSTVMRADKIVVMERGKIKEIGTHESLLKNKDSLYSHFWNLQIKLD